MAKNTNANTDDAQDNAPAKSGDVKVLREPIICFGKYYAKGAQISAELDKEIYAALLPYAE